MNLASRRILQAIERGDYWSGGSWHGRTSALPEGLRA